MTDTEIRSRLNDVFRQIFDDESIAIYDAMTAKDVAGWDSLNHVNLVVATEKAFGVRFKTKEVHALKNVGDLVALIVRKLTA
jgi:acyl carrier protein